MRGDWLTIRVAGSDCWFILFYSPHGMHGADSLERAKHCSLAGLAKEVLEPLVRGRPAAKELDEVLQARARDAVTELQSGKRRSWR